VLAPAVSAQETAAAPQAKSGLEEIIVTARKRVENLQQVPVAVTAITAQEISRKDYTSLEKLSSSTPSLAIGRSNVGGNLISLRGISSSITSISIEQSTAIVVDGVYYGQGRILNEGFFDLARLELLKGPQALFYGKNATAGVISLTSADPTDQVEFVTTGSYEFRARQIQLGLVGSGPLSDTLGVRVAVRGTRTYGGLSKNVAPTVQYTTVDVQDLLAGNLLTPVVHDAGPSKYRQPQGKELLGRVTLKWEPSDRLTATLKASGTISDSGNPNWNARAISCPGGFSQLDGYPCGSSFVTHNNDTPADIAAVTRYAKADGRAYARYRSYSLGPTITYELGDVAFTSVTNYNWNSFRFSGEGDFQAGGGGPGGSTPVWATQNTTFGAFSSELRALTSFDGSLNLMIGGLYQKTKFDYVQPVIFSGLSNSATTPENRYLAVTKNSSTKGETLSAFGQVMWKIVPTVELSTGVRYTHETKNSLFEHDYVNPALQAVLRPSNDPSGLGVVTAAQTFDDWSPDVTLTWKPTPDIMVYGGYHTAYKSGGFSNSGLNSIFTLVSDFTFDPEKARGFDIGVKTELLDKQLRFNVNAYTYSYHDLQVDFFNAVVFSFQTLSADARVKGIEAEFEFAPRGIDGLNLRGSINYNRARYTSFADAPCWGGQTQAGGCSILVGGSVRQNLNRQPLANAPDWVGSLGLGYERLVGNGLRFGLSVDGRYSDSYSISPFAIPDAQQKSYAVIDANIRIGKDDGRWEIALLGRNLTNRFYSTGLVDGPGTGTPPGGVTGTPSDRIGFFNQPRTIQLQFTGRF
jgi:outer membrane receptor protein involved in Fe transport